MEKEARSLDSSLRTMAGLGALEATASAEWGDQTFILINPHPSPAHTFEAWWFMRRQGDGEEAVVMSW